MQNDNLKWKMEKFY